MDDLTAIILAAGMGVRMGPRGRLHPKGFLNVGGTTLVEQSLATLRDWGAGRIVLVTGHLAEQYEALLGGSDVTLLHNPHYATTGSLLSLWTGLAEVDGPCVIVESDLIYAPQALAPIDGTADRLIVSGPTGAGDEVYIWAEPATDGRMRLVDMSKDIAAHRRRHVGELVGITGLTAATVARMKEVTRRELARDPAEHYEPGLVALARETDIDVVLIEDLPWAEIDDEPMLARAVRDVYPRVAAARAVHGLSPSRPGRAGSPARRLR